MKNIKHLIVTIILWIILAMIFWMITFLNWYFKYADSYNDVSVTIDWEEKWSWSRADLNAIDRALEKQYQALSKKLWWKYYFDNSSNESVIIKKTYYLDWQTVTVEITKTWWEKLTWDYKFDKLVEWKNFIESVKITAINGEPIWWELIFKWSELWSWSWWLNVLSTQ